MKFIGPQLCLMFIAAAAACWVYYDAKKRGYYPFAAICWTIGTFLTINTIFLMIVFIPLYLFTRKNRRFNINPDTKTVGIVMIAVGIIGLVGVHYMRPTSMVQGRQGFIMEPFYQIYLAVFGIISFFGVLKIVKGQKESKEK